MAKMKKILGQNFPWQEYPPIGPWCFSGMKIKVLTELYWISESVGNRSCGRLESRWEKDKHLEE